MPGTPGVNEPDVAVAVGGGPGAAGARDWGPLLKTTGPEQVGSPGPKTVKVTVPVGDPAPAVPVTVAVSEMGLPSGAAGVAWVAMVATAWSTTDVSLASLQAPVAGG